MGVIESIFLGTYGLFMLISYVIGFIFAAAMLYAMILRPIWGVFAEKGKRLYWLIYIILLVYGLIIGPVSTFWIFDHFGMIWGLIGLLMYGSIIWGLYRYSTKQDEENQQHRYI